MNYQKPIAELIGTYLLTLSVLLSVTVGSASMLGTAVIAGLVLATCVYTIGPISGCHINPAVTLALATGNKMKSKDVVHYILFQAIGALLAAFTLYMITSTPIEYMVNYTFSLTVFFTELLGAAFFLFGISAVVWGKVDKAVPGIVIGSSLLIGILLAVHAGGVGILNPAVALGVSALDFATLLGPIVGGIIGVQVYKYLLQ